MPVSSTFNTLIEELLVSNSSCQRTMIFCQTCKQCALIYSVSRINLEMIFIWKKHLIPKSEWWRCFIQGLQSPWRSTFLTIYPGAMGILELLHALLPLGWEWTPKGCIVWFILALPKILNAMFRNVEEQEGMGSQVHVFCCTMDCWQHIVHVTSRTTCPTIKNAGELLFIVIFQENSPLPCQVTSAVIFVQGAAGVGKKAAVSRLLCLWNLMLMTHPLKV